MANVPGTTSSAWRRMSIPSRGCLAVFAAVVLLGYVVQTAEAVEAIEGCASEALAAAVAAAPSNNSVTVQYLNATGGRVTVYGDPGVLTSLGRGDNLHLRNIVGGTNENHGNIIAIHTGNQIEKIAWYALNPSSGYGGKLEEAFLPKVTQIDEFGLSSVALLTVSMPEMSVIAKINLNAFNGASKLATVVCQKSMKAALFDGFKENSFGAGTGLTVSVMEPPTSCKPNAACSTITCNAGSTKNVNAVGELCAGKECDPAGADHALCCQEHAFCSTITCTTAGYTKISNAASTHCAGLTCNNSTDVDTCCEEDADMGPGAVVTPILLLQASAATLCLLGGSYNLQQAK